MITLLLLSSHKKERRRGMDKGGKKVLGRKGAKKQSRLLGC
jgi:hypothetical protein